MSPEQLRQASGCTEAVALAFAQPITVAIERWQIKRVAEFVAQMAVESARFERLQENLNYRTAERIMLVWPTRFHSRAFAESYVGQPERLANYVYGGRMGNYQKGDGWLFRGRGLKQLTGRANYSAYQAVTGVQAVEDPDKLLDPIIAADSAGWYWSRINADSLADDTVELTRKINGGTTGLQDRLALTEQAREALAA